MRLFDQFGRLFAKKAAPERTELPTAPILDSNRNYVALGLTPEKLAAYLQSADSGEVRYQAELFDQLEEKDGHLLCERDKRTSVILDLDFRITPASDSARDARVAEFVEDELTGRECFNDLAVSLQDAIGKGFAMLDNHWDVSSGQAIVDHFSFIEQKRFRFFDTSGYLRNYPRLLTDTDAEGIEIPPWKTVFHKYGGMSGHPARAGIYRVCAWMVLFKNYSIKDWVIFSERYGMPMRLGRYESGASAEDRRALKAAISSLGSDAAGIISKQTEIEFLKAEANATSSDLWERLINLCNAEMSKAILGQTLTAQLGDTGSYAASQTHNEVRLDLLRADGRAIAATVAAQLIRPLVGFNFGWDTECPTLEAIFDEGDDLTAAAEWVDKVVGWGTPVPVAWIREKFSIPAPQDGEEVVGLRAAPAPGDGGQVSGEVAASRVVVASEHVPAAPFDSEAGAAVAPVVEKAMSDPRAELVDQVAALVDQAESLESLQVALENLTERLDIDGFVELMREAMLRAELSGRFDVDEEVNG
jgi:phage gp29-like protein